MNIEKTKSLLFIWIMVVGTIVAFAQTPERAVIDPGWQKFWKPFQISARMRQKPMLKSYLSRNFVYSRTPSKEKGDPRDLAFAYWASPDVYGWEEIGKCVSLGWAKSEQYTKQFGKPARVAPASAVDDPGYTGYRLVFLQQKDKSWRCVLFLKKK